MALGSVASVGTTSASTPVAFFMSSAVLSSFSLRRAASTTLAPSCARALRSAARRQRLMWSALHGLTRAGERAGRAERARARR